MRHLSRISIITFMAVSFWLPLLSVTVPTAQAACPGTIPTTYGQATQSITVGGSGVGSYRVWARINAPSATASSFYLQVNGQCFVMGGASITAGAWTWVDYTDGSTTTKATASLTGGSTYPVTMTGLSAGLQLARVIFATDTSCVPSGDGAACATDNPPTVSLTAPTNGSTVSGTTSVTATASDDHAVASVAFSIDGSVVATDTATPFAYSWVTTGVSNASHTVTATATDTGGQTATSTATVTVSNASPDVTAPSTPTLSLGTVAAASVPLNWTAATDPTVGGATTSGVASYKVYRNGSATALATITAPTTTYTDSTVTQGTTYTYQVQAIDAASNAGTKSNTVTANTPTTADTTAPIVPTNLHQTSSTTTSIVLAWTASADQGANQTGVAGYHLYRNGTLIASPTPQATVTYTDSGLSAGTNYTYTISAYDNAGNASSQTAGLTAGTAYAQDSTAPSAPTLSLTSKSDTATTFSWTVSTDPTVAGSTTSGVSGYDLYRGATKVVTSTAQTFTDTGLTANTAYAYYIVAKDGANNFSVHSNTINVTTSAAPDTTAPSVPQGLLTSSEVAAVANLAWDPSTDTGGSGLAGYNIYRNGGTTKINATIVTTNLYSDTTVNGSSTYSYTVEAVDNAGNKSAKSSASSVTTPVATDTTAPSAPANLHVASSTINSVTITWNASTDNVGILGYHIYRNGTAVPIGDTPTTLFTDTELNPSSTYKYTVSAYDAGSNDSNLSSVLSATTKAVPAGLATGSNGQTVVLSAPSSADGLVVGQQSDGSLGGDTTVSVPSGNGTDAANDIVKIEYLIDGKLALTLTKAPFKGKIPTAKLSNGKHELTVITYDSKGGTTTKVLSVTVKNSWWAQLNASLERQLTALIPLLIAIGGFIVFGYIKFIVQRRADKGGPQAPKPPTSTGPPFTGLPKDEKPKLDMPASPEPTLTPHEPASNPLPQLPDAPPPVPPSTTFMPSPPSN